MRMFPVQQMVGGGGAGGGYQNFAGAPSIWGGPPTVQAGIAPAPGPMPSGILGDIGQVAGTAGNIYSLIQSNALMNAGRQGIAQANPFGPYRPMYGQQLMNLMQNPWSVTSLPGYQFLMDQGTIAANRQAAGPGGVGFGSTADKALLTQYGQGLADQFYNQQIQTLTGLSGANIMPANAAQMMGAAGAAQGSFGAGLQSTLGSVGNLINRFFPDTTPAFGQMGTTGYPVTGGAGTDPSMYGWSPYSPSVVAGDASAGGGGLAGGAPDWLGWTGDTGAGGFDMTAGAGAGGIDLSGLFQG